MEGRRTVDKAIRSTGSPAAPNLSVCQLGPFGPGTGRRVRDVPRIGHAVQRAAGPACSHWEWRTMMPLPDRSRTVASLLATLPLPSHKEELLWWPPDVFAVSAILLNETEAYRLVVSPPEDACWPTVEGWADAVGEAAADWVRAIADPQRGLPELVTTSWNRVMDAEDVVIDELSMGGRWDVTCAMLTLHSLADQACAGLGGELDHHGENFEARAWRRLTEAGSLARLPTWLIRVLPKTHLSPGGINLRSLSRYVASHVGRIDVSWTRVPLGDLAARDDIGTSYNLLLLPWPLEVASTDFRPRLGPLLNMDPSFGFFDYAPRRGLDFTYVESALRAAGRHVARVDGVILPEAAVLPAEVARLESILTDYGAYFVAAGVHLPATGEHLGSNYAHVGLRSEGVWHRFQCRKHHRWSLDRSQIRQYGLEERFDPATTWWEAITVPDRRMHVLDVGGGATTAVVICEDLARLDVMAEVLRYVGPTLLIALLMDGPQLASRWSARYASVFADDPGSTVLTLTSLGMAKRSFHPRHLPSRVVALWKDPERGLKEIEVARTANALLLQVGETRKTVWTADGRRHDATPRLVLDAVHQISAAVEEPAAEPAEPASV